MILAGASVFASAIATILAQRTGERYAVPLAGVLLTIIVIVFCELAPKIYGAANPEGVALHAAGVYRVLVGVARPALWLTNQLAYGFLRLFGVGRETRSDQSLSADELRTVVTEAGPGDPGAPPADAAVDPRPRAHHGERHHDAAPGDRGHRRQRALGGHPRRSCARPRIPGCRCTRASWTT